MIATLIQRLTCAATTIREANNEDHLAHIPQSRSPSVGRAIPPLRSDAVVKEVTDEGSNESKVRHIAVIGAVTPARGTRWQGPTKEGRGSRSPQLYPARTEVSDRHGCNAVDLPASSEGRRLER